MKNLFTILIVLLLAQTGFGQEKEIDYRFKMDIKAEQFLNSLKERNIDTLLNIFYHFNNGRGSNASKIFIWKENGSTFLKIIKIKKKDSYIEYKEEKISTDSIFTHYIQNKIDTVSSHPKSSTWLSHDYCYSIDILIDSTNTTCAVCNLERMNDTTHPKSIWVELIDKLIRNKYYK